MSEPTCTYPNRDEILTSILYDDDLDAAARAAFESHLTTCRDCRDELAALRTTRSGLQQWLPPNPVRMPLLPAAVPGRRARAFAMLGDVPVWAQTVAAVLSIGVAGAIANLHVTVGGDGLAVRTGWSAPAPQQAPENREAAAGTVQGVSREDLTAAVSELRAEIKSAADAVPQLVATATNGERASVRSETRDLVERNRRFLQNEMALRLAEQRQEREVLRRADMATVRQYMNVMGTTTRVLKNDLDTLAVRTSLTRGGQ